MSTTISISKECCLGASVIGISYLLLREGRGEVLEKDSPSVRNSRDASRRLAENRTELWCGSSVRVAKLKRGRIIFLILLLGFGSYCKEVLGALLGGCQRVRGERGVVLRIWGKGLVRLGCPGGRDRPAGPVCFVHVAIKRVSESGRCADFANNCAVLGIKRATFKIADSISQFL
jgi:hypothetical protein